MDLSFEFQAEELRTQTTLAMTLFVASYRTNVTDTVALFVEELSHERNRHSGIVNTNVTDIVTLFLNELSHRGE